MAAPVFNLPMPQPGTLAEPPIQIPPPHVPVGAEQQQMHKPDDSLPPPPQSYGYRPAPSKSALSSKDTEFHPNKLFVGGVSWHTKDDTFREYFTQFGELEDACVIREPSGSSRGFGFVIFKEAAAVEKLLNYKQLELDGRRIDCKRAVPREELSRANQRSSEQSRKLYIGGLAKEATLQDVKDHFKCFGPLADAVVMLDRLTGVSRGFGFVTFESEEGVAKVFSNSVHVICGKQCEIKRAVSRQEMQVSDRDDRRFRDDFGRGGWERPDCRDDHRYDRYEHFERDYGYAPRVDRDRDARYHPYSRGDRDGYRSYAPQPYPPSGGGYAPYGGYNTTMVCPPGGAPYGGYAPSCVGPAGATGYVGSSSSAAAGAPPQAYPQYCYTTYTPAAGGNAGVYASSSASATSAAPPQAYYQQYPTPASSTQSATGTVYQYAAPPSANPMPQAGYGAQTSAYPAGQYNPYGGVPSAGYGSPQAQPQQAPIGTSTISSASTQLFPAYSSKPSAH